MEYGGRTPLFWLTTCCVAGWLRRVNLDSSRELLPARNDEGLPRLGSHLKIRIITHAKTRQAIDFFAIGSTANSRFAIQRCERRKRLIHFIVRCRYRT